MKNILIVIFLAYNFFALSQNVKKTNYDSVINVDIIKIDSIGDIFIIYASADSDRYKIIARKTTCNTKKIEVGRNYKINVYPWFPSSQLSDPGYVYYIGGGEYTNIDWGGSLYSAKELCGLCYDSNLINSEECNKQNKLKELIEEIVLTTYIRYDIKTSLSNKSFIDSVMKNMKEFEILRKEIVVNFSFFPNKPISKVIENKESGSVFHGFILLEYEDSFLVVLNTTDNFDNNIVGWVDKKYFRKEFD